MERHELHMKITPGLLKVCRQGRKPLTVTVQVKYNVDGNLECYKAHLLGGHQIECFSYNKTYAPVVKMASGLCFLVAAVAKGMELHHMDVNNAFLHRDL